jgi:L-fuculose-phosphate aldolase
MTQRNELVSCVKDLYAAGLTTSVSGNHSIRHEDWMWITPSGIPRYLMRSSDLVRVNVSTGREVGKGKPSMEVGMHRNIYLASPNINAVIHTHSPYTIAVSISSEFKHVIEEAKIVVGMPAIIQNAPSGSDKLATAVTEAFSQGYRAVIVKNHGVVVGGVNIHKARAIVESLEEWSKIMTLTKIFGGSCEFLDD